MRTKKVTRYYCDFCSRGYFKRPTAIEHEKSCIDNPNRACPLCADNPGKTLPELLKILDTTDTSEKAGSLEEKLRELREAANGCPACMLAALNQHPITTYKCEPGTWEEHTHLPFDYKEQMRIWQQERNREVWEGVM